MNEIRLAVRTLLRTPGFTLAAVLTLGLGIGLNTAVFSLVNPILFRPLPFREPDRLVYLNEINPAQGFTKDRMMNVSYADFVDWRQRNRVFEDVGVYQSAAWTLAGRESADRVAGATVSATLFDLLGMRPLLGRGFQEGEDAPGAERVVLLGYGLWQRSFGGERSVLGEAVALVDRPAEVTRAAEILSQALVQEARLEQWLDLLRRLQVCGLIERSGAAEELIKASRKL